MRHKPFRFKGLESYAPPENEHIKKGGGNDGQGCADAVRQSHAASGDRDDPAYSSEAVYIILTKALHFSLYKLMGKDTEPIVLNFVGGSPLKPKTMQNAPYWAEGVAHTPVGDVYTLSTETSLKDRIGVIKCRISGTHGFRMKQIVEPGLYAVGQPDEKSDVFVSANYKLSFDSLRHALNGINSWVLVLDTKGINVWCAAGKGTFGTSELVSRIKEAGLDRLVSHRRIIVPQLGAPGVSAHEVKRLTGFRVHYGPVKADDIKEYLDAGYKASKDMRTVRFPFLDRLVLTPMEIIPAMKNYPLYALIILVVFGLRPEGIFFKDAITNGIPFLLMGLLSVIAGGFLTPIFLPLIPFRSFALKGLIAGAIVVLATFSALGINNMLLVAFSFIFFPAASSYIALQFTGSTTFTSMSGVDKELRISVPLYFIAIGVSVVLLAVYKTSSWGLL